MASHGVTRGSVPVKSDKDREKERKHIEQYKLLEKEVFEKIAARDFSNDSLRLTSRLLNQNPEYYTIWNHRRVILDDVFAKELSESPKDEGAESADVAAAEKAGLTVPQREILLVIQEDLQFQIPLLKQWPKCYWIWNHRQWLLVTATQHIPPHSTIELWKGELGLVGKMLSMDSRNFHGWNYRRVVVESIEQLSGKSLCEAEFEYTTKMIESNLSNFSAWHNRGQLIPRLLDERGADDAARRKLYDAEFELITKALYTDSYDQSLWFYHQYLMSALDASNPKAPRILQNVSDADPAQYLDQELDSIKDMLDGAEDCKYIYQALLEYSHRYLEVETGNKKVTMKEMREWLAELRKIDPLREGRWQDLERKLSL
ncbi:putative geranylgeranyl transferase type-2 subunit alpha [Septoria linicola]|nr:putative geranylgeranyl transferase type-2 subunit alpha [Septoria linicola]